jgi:hypothetical protein
MVKLSTAISSLQPVYKELAMGLTITLLWSALAATGFEQEAQGATEVSTANCDLERAIKLVTVAPMAEPGALRAPNRSAGSVTARKNASPRADGNRRLTRSVDLATIDPSRASVDPRRRPTDRHAGARRREQEFSTSHAGGVATGADDLINLIQTTVAPDTWEINGGRGSIYYFPNR